MFHATTAVRNRSIVYHFFIFDHSNNDYGQEDLAKGRPTVMALSLPFFKNYLYELIDNQGRALGPHNLDDHVPCYQTPLLGQNFLFDNQSLYCHFPHMTWKMETFFRNFKAPKSLSRK